MLNPGCETFQRLCLSSLHDYNHRRQVKQTKTKQKMASAKCDIIVAPPTDLPILRIVQSAVLKSTGVQQE